MRVLRAAVVVAWLATGLAAPAAAQTLAVTLADDRGRTITLQSAPRRIVSLLPSLTETVCALGACERLVAVDRWSNWPASVNRLPRVGGLDDAQVERIVRLQPDLVLAATSTRALARLEALGVRVAAFEPVDHAGALAMLDRVAALLGLPRQAGPLREKTLAELQRATERMPAWARGRTVYFEVDEGHYAAGRSSFVGETLARLGLVNIVGPELGPFPKLNPEAVLRAQPALVLAAERQLEGMASRPGWSGLKALRERRLCAFSPADNDLLIRPGPRMGEAAQRIVDCLAALPPMPAHPPTAP